MKQAVESLLSAFEKGRLSRRELIAGLTTLCLAPAAASAQSEEVQVAGLDHIAFRCADVQKSKRFYMDVLGATERSSSATSAFLTVGSDWIALFSNRDRTTGESDRERVGVDHVSFDITSHRSLEERLRAIRSKGLEPIHPEGTSRTYFRDPDGNIIQFS